MDGWMVNHREMKVRERERAQTRITGERIKSSLGLYMVLFSCGEDPLPL